MESGNPFICDLIRSSASKQFIRCIEEQLGERLIASPRILHDPYCGLIVRRKICDGNYEWYAPLQLADLSRVGCYASPFEVKFSTQVGDRFNLQEITVEGFELNPVFRKIVSYSAGVRHVISRKEPYRYLLKEWKTKINHKITLSANLPSCVFKRVLDVVQQSKVLQPYVPKFTSGTFALVTFHHAVTGDVRLCSCHKGVHDQMLNEVHCGNSDPCEDEIDSWDKNWIIESLSRGQYEDGLCHLCIAEKYGAKENFLRYGDDIDLCPYENVLVRRDGLDHKTAMREAKRKLGIGRYKREDKLCGIVRKLFKGAKVMREASPKWLDGLRFDIYLPEYKLAIEYQGEQHFEPVDFFGGEEGFKDTVRRDNLKRKLCREYGVSLVEIRYDQTFSEASLRHRLNRWLKRT